MAVVMLGIITGIPAVIMGNNAKRRILESGGAYQGEGMATAGQVMGWISIGLAAVLVVFFLVIFLIALAAIAAAGAAAA